MDNKYCLYDSNIRNKIFNWQKLTSMFFEYSRGILKDLLDKMIGKL